MKQFKEFWKEVYQEYGFESLQDILSNLFQIKGLFLLKFQLAGSFLFYLLIDVFNIIELHFYKPVGALVFVVVLVLGRAFTKGRVAIQVYKEAFNVNKAFKTIPIVVAHLFMLIACYKAGEYEDFLLFLRPACFGFIVTGLILLIGKDCVNLGWLDDEIWKKIASKIDSNESKHHDKV